MIRAANSASELHAVLSVEAATAQDACQQAATAGWIGHMRPIITSGLQRGANADTTLAFVAGYTMARSRPDMLLLGTGDGALGLDIARKIRETEPGCHTIATLSFAYSTSHLLSRTEIDHNLRLGADVLPPILGLCRLPGPAGAEELLSLVGIIGDDGRLAILQFRRISHPRLARIFVDLEPVFHGLLKARFAKQCPQRHELRPQSALIEGLPLADHHPVDADV